MKEYKYLKEIVDGLKEKKGIVKELKDSSDEITEFSKKFQGYEKTLNDYIIETQDEQFTYSWYILILSYAILFGFGSSVFVLITIFREKFCLAGVLHFNWILLGSLSMLCFYLSPQMIMKSIEIYNYCESTG